MYCELDIPKQETQKAEVLGRDLLTLKRRDIPALRKEMGIIFQDFQLLHDRSVFKNLQFILHSTGWKSNKDINNRIEQVLSDVGMSDKKTNIRMNFPEANSNVLQLQEQYLIHRK